MNIDNLDKLIVHLEKVNDKNFRMATWFVKEEPDEEWNEMLEEYIPIPLPEKLDWANKPASDLLKYMRKGKGDCGTAACIAGHASVIVAAERGQNVNEVYAGGLTAIKWLGISIEESHDLFIPWSYVPSMKDIPADAINLKWAIEVLKHFKETALAGDPEIDWSKGRPSEKELTATINRLKAETE